MSAIDSVSYVIRNPGEALRRPFIAAALLLFDPDTFFDRRKEDDGWLKPVLILAVTGLVGTIAMFFAIRILRDAYPASGGLGGTGGLYLSERVWRQLLGGLGRPVIGVVVVWIGLSTAFVGISWLYDGHGTLAKTLQLSAWGFVPIAVANAIYYGGITLGLALKEYTGLLRSFRAQSQSMPPFNDPQASATWVLNQVREEPWFVLVAIVSIVLVAYSGYLWAHAVKHSRDLTTEQAYRVVAIPTLAFVGVLVYDILTYTVL